MVRNTLSSEVVRLAVSRTTPVSTITICQGDRRYRMNVRLATKPEETAFIAEYNLPADGGLPASIAGPNELSKALEPAWSVKKGASQKDHFHPEYGWMNDPNGLFFLDGEWHVFYQYNPLGVSWDNMHWGHAVSKDLKNWRHLPIALHPDEYGVMYSGSAVVDEKGVAGFGKDAVLLFYTNCDVETHKGTQCLAVSTDRGRTFRKYNGGLPIIGNITGDCDRDPNIVWDPQAEVWRMALYLGACRSKSSFLLLESSDLIHWTPTDIYEIPEGAECPGIRPMVDEATGDLRWLFTEASGRYRVGTISKKGKVCFTSETRRFLYGNAYAGQSFFGTPFGKIVYLSWIRMAPSPERQWTGCLSTPLELHLRNGELFVSPFFDSADYSIAKLDDYMDFTPNEAAGVGRVLTDTFSTEYFDDSGGLAVALCAKR
ncbi:MAG: glycoside hydrolase family 32 protein [Victivallales bacterium]|nr:glycoside hydrolase family 32 protein [Victivallales bacterium]